jgi:hypothetical protein
MRPLHCRSAQSLAALRTVVRTRPVAARPGSGPGRGRRLKSRVRVGPGEPWPTIIRAPSALPTARGRLPGPYARGRCQCRRRHRIIMVRMVPLTGSGPALVSSESLTRRSAVDQGPGHRALANRLGTSPGPGRIERTGSPRSADRQLEVSREQISTATGPGMCDDFGTVVGGPSRRHARPHEQGPPHHDASSSQSESGGHQVPRRCASRCKG